MIDSDVSRGTTLRPVLKAMSSSAATSVGSATASVISSSVRPVGTTPYLQAVGPGISLMISGAISSGKAIEDAARRGRGECLAVDRQRRRQGHRERGSLKRD